MGNAAYLRRLGDMRTALTRHVRAKPAEKGTAHRDLFLLGNERDRLEAELGRLEKQRERVQERLTWTFQAIARLQREAEADDAAIKASLEASGEHVGANAPRGPRPNSPRGRFKTLPMDY